MIKNWYITGDTHGNFERVSMYNFEDNSALIVLGDSGLNYFLNKRDSQLKESLLTTNITYYIVRGNHEARPEEVPNMISWYDEEVANEVWMEEKYPYIRYFKDGEAYSINGLSTIVIGGAYSVDKSIRLMGRGIWHPKEQLTKEEMLKISSFVRDEAFDMVLSHTCPISWQPTDLFINAVTQSTVDKTMEIWLEELKDSFKWGLWLFGHFHDDRLVRPRVEMLHTSIQKLSDISIRWQKARLSQKYLVWLKKDPLYYIDTK